MEENKETLMEIGNVLRPAFDEIGAIMQKALSDLPKGIIERIQLSGPVEIDPKETEPNAHYWGCNYFFAKVFLYQEQHLREHDKNMATHPSRGD